FKPRLTSTPVALHSGLNHVFTVEFDSLGNQGRHEDTLELVFYDVIHKRRFVIIRPVRAVVAVQVEQALLAPKAPYVAPKPKPDEPKTTIIDGEKPAAFAKVVWRQKIPDVPVPRYLYDVVDDGPTSKVVQNCRCLLPHPLDVTTFRDHRKMLLWLEEIQAREDIKNYNQSDVEIAARPQRKY
ncbi:hypothetical protein FRB99_004850, partial [Tulasnella sp. 403]